MLGRARRGATCPDCLDSYERSGRAAARPRLTPGDSAALLEKPCIRFRTGACLAGLRGQHVDRGSSAGHRSLLSSVPLQSSRSPGLARNNGKQSTEHL